MNRRVVVAVAVFLVVATGSAESACAQSVRSRPEASVPTPDPEAARKALKEGSFPWYNATSDRVKPVLPEPDFGAGVWKQIGDALESIGKTISGWFSWLNRYGVPGVGRLGDVVAVGMVMLLLTVVVVILLELLRRYRPIHGDQDSAGVSLREGRAQRIEGLPAGVGFATDDPLGEAKRARDRGDYAAAVVYLFAHQLLSLERVRQLRLIPGRTGRQLVRSVGNRTLRSTVEPTLRVFEAVYYGHHGVSAATFEEVWSASGAFEQALAAVATEVAS